MARALGVDLGTKRIGLATSDARGTLASPLVVLVRSGDINSDHRALLKIAAEEEAELIVVGMPVDLRGDAGPAAQAALSEIAAMEKVSPIPVLSFDERLTTASAAKALSAQGVNSKKRRDSIDKFAAAVMLQGWLDAQPKDAIKETR